MQNEIGRLRRFFKDGRADLFPPEAHLTPCRELLKRTTRLVDSVVDEIYKVSCRYADRQARRTRHSGLAIVATGGYGRGELNPFSDVDIAFIPSEEEDPWVEAAVHMAFRLVMDVFLSFKELRVGYSYRPASEVSTWDLPTKTSLLDSRHLCGDRYLTETLEFQLRNSVSPLDFKLEIEAELALHDRVRSAYSVEPNLKEGPGSLRDLHRGRWIYKLLLGAGNDGMFSVLQNRGYLPEDRIREVIAAAEWFWSARNWLHLVTGKRSDVLINNFQDRIGRELGNTTGVEWLSRHYGHAETLAMFRDAALRRAMEGPIDLGGVRLQDGSLHLEKPGDGSSAAIKLFHLSQRYSIPVGIRDLNAMDGSRGLESRVERPSPQETWSFLAILSEGRNVAATLRALCRFGLLDRFIPGYSQVMRLVPPDPAHRYTVGEHSLKIIERLEDLRLRRDPSEERFAEILGQCTHFDVLCLAALLHDMGKRAPTPSHSEASAEIVSEVSGRLELAPEKTELLELIVLHHLLLVRTSRLQDLKSVGVIQSVADKFPSLDALRYLYLFTYVDTRAVAEKSWTSMDYRDLEELYRKVADILSGQAAEASTPESREDRIGQIRRRLASTDSAPDEEAIRKHCDSMPASYILNTPLDEIAFHIQLLSRLSEEQVVLDIYNRPGDDFSELTICTFDDPQPGMLAKITGVLYGCDIDIHKAQVFTMEKERPVALDTLWIRSAGVQISENRARRIRTSLREVLTGARNVESFLRGMGKHPPSAIPVDSVALRNDLSEEHTVLHIVARDLQGLLYLMTRALSRSGLHIHSAKVATWEAKAENNFYITTLTGGQIPGDELPEWKEHLTRMFRGLNAE